MTHQQLNIEQHIEQDRIDQLYTRSKTAILTLFVISAVYVLLFTKKFAWQPLFIWYATLTAVLLGRLLLVRFYAGTPKKTTSLPFWLNMFRLGILANGVILGSLNFIFFPRESLSYLLLAIIFPYGITAGAVTILVDLPSFCIYAITLMMPIVYQAFAAGNELDLGVGILTILLILFFLKFSKEYNDNYIFTTRLLHKNKALMQDIEEEKNKLSNRLGRILNDSSNEIFVVNADTLSCIQVNVGAVEDLGYSYEDFAGLCLLKIFTELDRPSFAELLKPLHNGDQETVIYKGINQRKDGTTYPVEARLQLSTQDDPPIVVIIAQDITERKEWENKLILQATFDQLTGLFNRYYIQAHIESAFIRARRHRQKVALLFIDLDNFKTINDTLGHGTGDEVLKQTAERIRTLLRESDTPARTGGDEFTVLLENMEKNAHIEVVARKLINIFKRPFNVKDQVIYTTVSIGISIYPDDAQTIDQLMKYADIAMYQVKEDGRNDYRFFSRKMRRASEKQIVITNHLWNALSSDEFTLFFQPKIDIINSRIIGAEALLRWNNHELGEVSPNIFIPLAEKMGLISDIGFWILETACREAMRWQTASRTKLQVSVNVSSQQFRTGTLLANVDRALTLSGLPHDRLELEITESLLLQDSDAPLTCLEILHGQGIGLALDDFGTGYSSLSYLRRFPLQVLKIDRSFICDLEFNQNSRALVEAIIAMAKSLKMEIVAEGVKNERQLDFLRQHDVKIIQGYIFSPPIPAEQFNALLQDESMIMGDKKSLS